MTMIVMLLIGLVYLDFSVWYAAEMTTIWSSKKRKFRGLLCKLWDRL